MPYVDKSSRDKFRDVDFPYIVSRISKIGELNYLITKLVLCFMRFSGESYRTYNDIIGVLECVKLELYRKQASYYEDNKEKVNGGIMEEI